MGLSHKIGYKLAAAAVVASLTTGAAMVATEGVASAGTNGQQVDFYLGSCGGGLSSASISGTNQFGHAATWWGRTSNDYVFPGGWWWVGNITVNYVQNGHNYYVHAYIPQGDDTSFQYWSNIVVVDCHGSWKYGSSTLASGSGFNVACINLRSDPTGHYTQYTRFSGYYGYTWNDLISPNGYGIAYAGTTPWLVTGRISWMNCG